ncbi:MULTISPECIES: hypothetical protein [Prochlorococcus]|uniref:hypothetical protein n=1 Tax=Prochlorococcus TaxID=1218 RepID=UPI000533B173|nr:MULTISPECIES: hypothetical protein [Prochlorococcus]KGG12225.1 putative Adenoviral fiber protein [Prochlorococcus sp. MIT 0601]
MRASLRGYWFLTWLGLFSNIGAIIFFAFVVSFYNPSFRVGNISFSAGIHWPSAVVGIVACSGLLAERRWGVILAIVALSMTIIGCTSHAIFLIQSEKYFSDLSIIASLISALNLMALIYWCRPAHRKTKRIRL